MAYETVFDPAVFQTSPPVYQIDKAREDEDKDKGHGKAKLEPPPTGGTAKVED